MKRIMNIKQLFTDRNEKDPCASHSTLYLVEKDGEILYVTEDFCEGYSTPYGEGGDVEPCMVFRVLTPQQVEVNAELRIFLETGEMNVKMQG